MSNRKPADWRERARKLQDRGGVPKRRAQVVALIEQGHTHAEVQETLGLNKRSEVARHVGIYRQNDRSEARWLAEHGPDI